jgi:hypothetical protein
MRGNPLYGQLTGAGARSLGRERSKLKAALDEDGFWKIIELPIAQLGGAVGGQPSYPQEALDIVVGELSRRSDEDIERFHFYFDQALKALWQQEGEMLKAAWAMQEYLSDDSFEYFMRWVIAQGRDIFEAALDDSQTLVQAFARQSGYVTYNAELLGYAASYAREKKA